jgi:hypothetical protein
LAHRIADPAPLTNFTGILVNNDAKGEDIVEPSRL